MFLGLLSVTGLPKIPMLVLGGCCGGIAWMLTRSEKKVAVAKAAVERDKVAKKEPEKVEKLLDLDTMELEVGYGLVRLVDTTKGGDLLERISLIRRQIAMDLGIIVPPIRIRDNMQLGANDYAVKIKGQVVARGVTYPEQFLAMDNGATTGPIPGGSLTTEPAFGLPAYWITESAAPPGRVDELHRRRSDRGSRDASDRSHQDRTATSCSRGRKSRTCSTISSSACRR